MGTVIPALIFQFVCCEEVVILFSFSFDSILKVIIFQFQKDIHTENIRDFYYCLMSIVEDSNVLPLMLTGV